MGEVLFLSLVNILHSRLLSVIDFRTCSMDEFLGAVSNEDDYMQAHLGVSIKTHLVSTVPQRRGVDALNDYRVVIELGSGKLLITFDHLTTDEPSFLE